MRRFSLRRPWVWLVPLLVGCGGSNYEGPRLCPVEGTVTLAGKPLSGVTLQFVPIGSTAGSGATGYTGQDGKYQLVSTRGFPGTPAGDYRVVAKKLVMPDGSDFPADSMVGPMDSPARQVLPSKYSARGNTVLKVTVIEGPNVFDFPLSK